jgi:23S rRNA (uracil1939-C5)-methyltransferase
MAEEARPEVEMPARGAPMTEEWRIDRLVPGGDGMTRLGDGRVGFATGALPGDLLHVLAKKDHGSWVRAERWELVEPGPDRVEPPCPVAARCGGCDWMQLARPAQLLAKGARLRVHVDVEGRIGLYAKHSHELVEIDGCPVSEPAVEQALSKLRELGRAHPGALARWGEIEIRAAPAGPPLTLWLEPRPPPSPRSARDDAFLAELRRSYVVAERGGPIEPGAVQRWPLPGVALSVPPGVFVQVNPAVNRELVAAVTSRARELGLSRFLDLYSGAGNFALPLLASGMSGLAVERAGAGIRAARQSARKAGLSDQSFFAGEVLAELERLARRHERFDLVVLDPPREGARECMSTLVALAPPHIAYCGCDPVTLARDVKTLLSAGYRLEHASAWDMFPHTHHVETLVWLGR